MPIPQSLINEMPDYSWADIAKMAKAAMLALTISQSTSFMGHMIQKTDMDSLRALYELATGETDTGAAAGSGGDIVLVQRGQRI